MSTRTALHKAVEESSVEKVISLLDQGIVDINGSDDDGCSALHYAVKVGFKPIVEVLLARGADVNTKDNIGRTPLHIAVKNESESIVEVLLARDADVNSKNYVGDTPLHIAVKNESESIVKVLLARGADVNIKNDFGDTPLHYADYDLPESIVDLLLARGADVNTKNNVGNTPLHSAVNNQSGFSVEVLLARGADINSKNNRGDTPLHSAARYGSEVDALLARNADVNETDYEEDYEEFESIFETLVASGADAKNIPINTRFTKLAFIKLKCANFDIGTEIRVSDLNNSDHEFHVRCLEEVERLKLRKFNGCSLYDIFCKQSDPSFLPNEEMELATQSDILKTEFPLFANLLRVAFQKAKQRYILLNLAQQIFKVPLPNEMRRLILSFLDGTDLVNLVKACEKGVCDEQVECLQKLEHVL